MSDGPLSPEEVAHRGFPTAFRGFDTGDVRTYLQRVANELRDSIARERDLNRRLADAEHRAAHPVIQGEELTRVLGEEMGRILATAQEAANELRSRAEENAARILREAHDQAQRIRADAESVLAERTEEAEGDATEIRRVAAAEATSVVERARREADLAAADGEVRARAAVEEAQAVRARILGELTRRRRLLQMQVETLRAGRERLLDAYRLVRRSVDEVADELQRAETEARQAATEAGQRAADTDSDEEVDADGEVEHPAALGPASTDAADVPAPDDELPSTPVTDAPGEPAGGPPAEAADTHRPPQLRLVRPPHPEPAPEGAASRDAVEPPSAESAVRVIATRPGGSPADRVPSNPTPAAVPTEDGAPPAGAPEPPTEPPAPPTDVTAGETPGPPAAEAAPPAGPGDATGEAPAAGVDALFARIRAGRADAVAKAHEVLASDETAPLEPAPAEQPAPALGDEALLQRRDAAVADVEARLTRKLKRALQDEQNELLDRLRSLRSTADALLAPAGEQAARYVAVADELVRSAATAGAEFASSVPDGGTAGPPPVDDVVRDLAAAVTEPLRRALERAIRSDAGGDATAVVERIGAVYRECKAQRIEGLAGDAVTAAFSRGALSGLEPGRASRWVVDDDGRPCPDCDDNALAGPTAAGEAFPTGQAHPPAHAGCRCLLAPAEVAAAVNGTG
jgi:DivIVA domain-containing protein